MVCQSDKASRDSSKLESVGGHGRFNKELIEPLSIVKRFSSFAGLSIVLMLRDNVPVGGDFVQRFWRDPSTP